MTRSDVRSDAASQAKAPASGDVMARASLAWNGLRLGVPVDWAPARLGRDYLGLESPDGPVMEVRFSRSAGNVAPDEVVRRMHKKSGLEVRTGPSSVPADWLSALPGRDNTGFDCGGAPISRGVASLCRECGTLAVIRFFPAGEGKGGAVAREVLASLRDHDRTQAAFELYGLRLDAPEGMTLARFSFPPGRFDLEFTGYGRTLGFSRFAPAQVLLAGTDLCGFAAKYLALPGLRLTFAPHRWRGREAALAVTPAPSGVWDAAAAGVARFFRRRRQARVMVWREAAADKLAAVAWCGLDLPDEAFFDKVCAGYGII